MSNSFDFDLNERISDPSSQLKVSSLLSITPLKKPSSFHFETFPTENSYSFSSFFTLKSDLTSCPPRIKINFSVLSFEKCASAANSDLDSVNSADPKEPLHVYNTEESDLNI